MTHLPKAIFASIVLTASIISINVSPAPAQHTNSGWQTAQSPSASGDVGAQSGSGSSPAVPSVKSDVDTSSAPLRQQMAPSKALTPSSVDPQDVPSPEKIRRDRWIAYRLANYRWLDRAAAYNPRIIAAITAHSGPARILAEHPHLAAIADADHYVCRRLCRWKGATQKLIRNKSALHVISLDPEGIYEAIRTKPQVARLLARDPRFADMIANNPDLGRVITDHMR